MTAKETHDGQKNKIKARLVAKGFQETDAPQADSPTAQRDSIKLCLAISQIKQFEKLRSIDIRAAFLQADELERELLC